METQAGIIRNFGLLTFLFFLMASVPGLNPNVASKLGEAGLVCLGAVTTLVRVTSDDDIKKDIRQIRKDTSEGGNNNAVADLVINPIVPTIISQVTHVKPDLSAIENIDEKPPND